MSPICTVVSGFAPQTMIISPGPVDQTVCDMTVPGGFPANSQIVANTAESGGGPPFSDISNGTAVIGLAPVNGTFTFNFIIAVPPGS